MSIMDRVKRRKIQKEDIQDFLAQFWKYRLNKPLSDVKIHSLTSTALPAALCVASVGDSLRACGYNTASNSLYVDTVYQERNNMLLMTVVPVTKSDPLTVRFFADDYNRIKNRCKACCVKLYPKAGEANSPQIGPDDVLRFYFSNYRTNRSGDIAFPLRGKHLQQSGWHHVEAQVRDYLDCIREQFCGSSLSISFEAATTDIELQLPDELSCGVPRAKRAEAVRLNSALAVLTLKFTVKVHFFACSHSLYIDSSTLKYGISKDCPPPASVMEFPW